MSNESKWSLQYSALKGDDGNIFKSLKQVTLLSVGGVRAYDFALQFTHLIRNRKRLI